MFSFFISTEHIAFFNLYLTNYVHCWIRTKIFLFYSLSDSTAMSCAKLMWEMGSKNLVKIIKGRKLCFSTFSNSTFTPVCTECIFNIMFNLNLNLNV